MYQNSNVVNINYGGGVQPNSGYYSPVSYGNQSIPDIDINFGGNFQPVSYPQQNDGFLNGWMTGVMDTVGSLWDRLFQSGGGNQGGIQPINYAPQPQPLTPINYGPQPSMPEPPEEHFDGTVNMRFWGDPHAEVEKYDRSGNHLGSGRADIQGNAGDQLTLWDDQNMDIVAELGQWGGGEATVMRQMGITVDGQQLHMQEDGQIMYNGQALEAGANITTADGSTITYDGTTTAINHTDGSQFQITRQNGDHGGYYDLAIQADGAQVAADGVTPDGIFGEQMENAAITQGSDKYGAGFTQESYGNYLADEGLFDQGQNVEGGNFYQPVSYDPYNSYFGGFQDVNNNSDPFGLYGGNSNGFQNVGYQQPPMIVNNFYGNVEQPYFA